MRKGRHLGIVVAGAVLLLLLLQVAVRAGEPWHVHYKQGLELEAQARWEEALAEFSAAASAEPRPRRHAQIPGNGEVSEYDPHYHIAHCLVELGRFGAAALHLRKASRAGVTPRKKLDELRRRIEGGMRGAALSARQPLLSVRSEPAGASVFLDGRTLGTTPLGPTVVPPGSHTLRVEAPGFAAVERRLHFEPGPPQDLDFVLVPLPQTGQTPVEKLPVATPTEVPTLPTPPPTPTPRPSPLGEAARMAEAPTVTPTHVPTPREPEPQVTAPIQATQLRQPSRLPLLAGGAIVAVLLLLLLGSRLRPRVTATATTQIHEVPTLHAPSGAEQLGEFELVGTLGRGGMATTYRARRRHDGCEFALKIPHDSCLVDETFVARFLREGTLGEQLHHPSIVRIVAVGESGGKPYLAMELVSGHTLKQEIREHGSLPVRRALEIARDIAEALDYAHAKGVIHRDLKPENIMLQPSGKLKIMDFGIAKVGGHSGLTSTNIFLGTPLYAAPEMVDPKHIDHRVDLYALGIILFEMLQGTVPFVADSPYRVLEMHLREPLPARHELRRPVPEAVWTVVEKLCAKDREQRYQSAQELLVELNRLLNTRLGETHKGTLDTL